MECLGKAIEAKETAEKKMLVDDFQGGRISAMEANKLFPQLQNISQILAVCDVHCAAQTRICGSEKDWYEILQVERLADDATIKKQYRKLALLLHPDKNKFPGAEAAFKLIGEANMVLSDKVRRASFDIKHRASMTAAIPKAPPRQRKTKAAVKKAEEVKNMKPNVSDYQFNKSHHKQPTIPNMFSQLTRFFCYLCKCWYPIKPVDRVTSCPNCFKENVFNHQGAPPESKKDNIKPQGGNAFPQQKQVPLQAFGVGVQNTGKVPSGQLHSEVNPGKKFGSEHVKQTGCTTKVGTQGAKFTTTHLGNEANFVPCFGAEHMKHTVGINETSGSVKSKVEDVSSGATMSNAESTKAKVSSSTKDKNRKRRKSEADITENYVNRSSEREEATPKESRGNPTASHNVVQESISSTRKSSRQRKNVTYNESIVDDDDFMSPYDKTLKDAKDKAANAAHVPPAAVVDEYPDPEFSDFDKLRNQNCVTVNQIWACYDTVDGMPRFYAKIKKVHLLKSKLCIAWLEADPEKQEEIDWVDEELPVSCGKYMCVDTEETIDYHTLSHLVGVEKGTNKDTYIVYPKKGETWAIFTNWDIGWSSDPDLHRKNKLEIVEILSDFCLNTGITVEFLGKVNGFISLYRRKGEGAASILIPSSEMLRFSHQIPSFKMTGSEGVGVPPGSFELDPAALPVDP
ncbi:DnaJ-like subfamily B member 14 [Heracleum sosnowskyi]|uniref:DnaJ-like subfamily B member 14 n=1 Tax=Heracleum sosnowskyi TaxID=360622 RepID=A0AAD8J4C2_9APIA|nr:DnaJ-like subfamily B member 14 [Heracleum sosnowskyi]